MDVLKAQLDRIARQLAGLTASQKMLTASLVAIMVMTLLYWARYAGAPEMVEVADAPFAADQVAAVQRTLRAARIEFAVAGDKVVVPAEQHLNAIAALAEDQLLPRDSGGGFDDVLSKLSAFSSSEISQHAYVEMRQQQIAAVIRKMKGVKSATVLIDTTEKQRVEGSVEPKASVFVQLRDGVTPEKKFAQAVGAFVDGSTAALKRRQIQIIINDRLFPMHDPSSADGPDDSSELADRAWSEERHAVEKIQGVLSYFNGGVLANVRVKIDNERKQTRADKIDDVKSKPLSERTESTENRASPAQPQDPGFGANSGASVTQAAQAQPPSEPTQTKETSDTKFENLASHTTSTTDSPGGQPTIVSATVNVPRSYYARMLQVLSGSKTKPDEKAVDEFVTAQLPKVRDAVRGVLGDLTADAIHVDAYADLPVMMAGITDAGGGEGGGGVGSIGGSTLGAVVQTHAKELAIGALATVSLFMVLTMARKTSPVPMPAAVMESEPPVRLPGTEPVAGEVGEGNPLLDGMELDEDAIKAQQMVEQVSTMVKENPDAAANLIKRWMNRS